MLISLLRSRSDKYPEVVEVEWADLVETLTNHVSTGCYPCPGKDCPSKDGRAWSPVEYAPCPPVCRNAHDPKSNCGGNNYHRLNANVVAFSAAVFDIDHTTFARLQEIEALIEARGLAACLHSTHSHNPPDDCCVRLVFPVSRPVKPAEWKAFRAAVIADLGLPADPQTKDVARLYYTPTWPGMPAPEPIAGFTDGAPLDVDAYLRVVPNTPAPIVPDPVPAPLPQTREVDLGHLQRLLAAASRSGDQERRSILRKVVAGEALADVGGRDATLNRACSLVVWALPEGLPPEAILELMRHSIRSMPGDEEPEHWESEAYDMIVRSQQRRAVDTAQRQAKANAWVSSLLAEPDKTVDNEDEPEEGKPYSNEQLTRWAQEQGDPEGFGAGSRRWIIQRGNAYYVFVNGRYKSPIIEKELAVSLPRDLARSPVPTTITSNNGVTSTIPVRQILLSNASVARDVQASLVLQKSVYVAETQTFHEAVRPLRLLEAREHPEVDEWLRLLGGDETEKLLDWVATVTRLEKQTCALYLQGSPGSGKTLFANGLARLWSVGGPTDLASALDDGFNEAFVNCPLLFADEAVPKRQNITSDLRKLIGSPATKLKRKYMPECTVVGSVRLIIAGNNAHLLTTPEDLSTDDLEAVSGRFLYVKSHEDTATYLRQFGDLNHWITHDVVAEHALWLRETRDVIPGRRFLVEGRKREFHEQLAVTSGLGNNIMEWIARFLDDPTANQSPRAHLVQVGNGHIFVAAEAFTNEATWQKYVPSAKVQSTTRVSKALAQLSDGRMQIHVKGKTYTMSRIPPERVYAWVKSTGAMNLPTLRKRINSNNEVLTDALIEGALQETA